MMNTMPERLPPALMERLVSAGYVVREPITESALRRLLDAAGSLPEGVTRYLATSDGLSHPTEFGICGSKQMLSPYPSNSLLPLREDGCGDYDSVIIEPGPAFGAVVFWDHETSRAEYLLASSVPSYLELLLVRVPKYERWDPNRQGQNEFVRTHDADAARLLNDPRFHEWVGERGRSYMQERPEPPPPGEPLPTGARVGVNPLTKERVVFIAAPKHRMPPVRR